MDGSVHGGVREVEKKGLVLAAVYELHGLVGADFLDAVLVHLIEQALDLVIANEGHDAAAVHAGGFEHVIGIWDAEIVIKALHRGQKCQLIAEVPLADALRSIAQRLQSVRDRVLVWMQPVLRPWRIHPGHRNACAIAPGHDLCPRHTAYRRSVERREPHSLLRHTVEVRRLLLHRAKRADVAIAEVVDEVDDNVGLRISRAERRAKGREAEQQDGEEVKGMFHGWVFSFRYLRFFSLAHPIPRIFRL